MLAALRTGSLTTATASISSSPSCGIVESGMGLSPVIDWSCHAGARLGDPRMGSRLRGRGVTRPRLRLPSKPPRPAPSSGEPAAAGRRPETGSRRATSSVRGEDWGESTR